MIYENGRVVLNPTGITALDSAARDRSGCKTNKTLLIQAASNVGNYSWVMLWSMSLFVSRYLWPLTPLHQITSPAEEQLPSIPSIPIVHGNHDPIAFKTINPRTSEAIWIRLLQMGLTPARSSRCHRPPRVASARPTRFWCREREDTRNVLLHVVTALAKTARGSAETPQGKAAAPVLKLGAPFRR